MTILKLRQDVAFLEGWDKVQGPLVELLTQRLIDSAKTGKSDETKTIADLITDLESISEMKTPELRRAPKMRVLNSMKPPQTPKPT